MDPVEQLNKNPKKTSHKIPEIRELRALKNLNGFHFLSVLAVTIAVYRNYTFQVSVITMHGHR